MGQSELARFLAVVSISADPRLALVLVVRAWRFPAFLPTRLGLDLVVLRVRRFRVVCSAVRRIVLVYPVVIWPKSAKFASYSCRV